MCGMFFSHLRRLRHTKHYSPYVYLIYLRHLRHASRYIEFDGMVGKLSVSAFQNFFRIENPLSIKEVMSQNVWYVLFPSSTSSTYIALQPLCVFDLSLTSSTYFNIHLLWLVLISSTSSTYIALQPLCIFDLSSTSSTCFDIHRI